MACDVGLFIHLGVLNKKKKQNKTKQNKTKQKKTKNAPKLRFLHRNLCKGELVVFNNVTGNVVPCDERGAMNNIIQKKVLLYKFKKLLYSLKIFQFLSGILFT